MACSNQLILAGEGNKFTFGYEVELKKISMRTESNMLHLKIEFESNDPTNFFANDMYHSKNRFKNKFFGGVAKVAILRHLSGTVLSPWSDNIIHSISQDDTRPRRVLTQKNSFTAYIALWNDARRMSVTDRSKFCRRFNTAFKKSSESSKSW